MRELRLVEMPKSVNFWHNFTVKYFIIFIKQLVFLSYNEQALNLLQIKSQLHGLSDKYEKNIVSLVFHIAKSD